MRERRLTGEPVLTPPADVPQPFTQQTIALVAKLLASPVVRLAVADRHRLAASAAAERPETPPRRPGRLARAVLAFAGARSAG
jgi:hypothetical protein